MRYFALKWFGGQAGFPFDWRGLNYVLVSVLFAYSFLRSASKRSLRFLQKTRIAKDLLLSRPPRRLSDSAITQRLSDGSGCASTTTSQRIINALTSRVVLNKEFIAADLVQRKLYLFQDGTRPPCTTFWKRADPTLPGKRPSGFYQIQSKEAEHFSSIGT